MSFGGRLSVVIGLFIVAAGFAVWAVIGFLLPQPPTVDFTSAQPAGAPVDLTVQTVGSIGNGYGNHPTWVSYLVKDPQGQWIHSTIWKVPAHTRINLTVEHLDSGSLLHKQPAVGLVPGTIGLTDDPQRQEDLRLQLELPATGSATCSPSPPSGSTFRWIGVPSSATNVCSQAPCSYPSLAMNAIKALASGPRDQGEYPWQCFVPCGLGWLYGNGGPMSTVGYMGGFLDVVS